jgi:hypothetical protein
MWSFPFALSEVEKIFQHRARLDVRARNLSRILACAVGEGRFFWKTELSRCSSFPVASPPGNSGAHEDQREKDGEGSERRADKELDENVIETEGEQE